MEYALAHVSQQGRAQISLAHGGSGFGPRMVAQLPPNGSRRRLKRNATNQRNVEVQLQKCIRGGRRKQWMVLDTRVFMERECVSIKSTQPWLHMMLAGTLYRSTFHNAISNFANECHDELQKLGAAAADSSQASVAAASSQASPAPVQDCKASRETAKVGRDAIIARDDSSEEDLVQPIVRRRSKNHEARGWATVSVRGMNIECYAGRGRQLLVPIDGNSIDLTVEHLSHRGGEALHQQCDEKTAAFGDLLKDADVGKIAWRQNRQASSQSVGFWQIMYRNQRGLVVRGRNGLTVPRGSLAGTPWSPEEQRDAARMVLTKARAQWDLLDCSTADRFAEETT